ncbi:hypothetical protein [Spirosoma sordidisoli]|uniref:Uncharacterized protein n=1 Tax=Spirosoma sordidisoli TaxID=2502893 RepID=A0A4Q2UMZ6_9BACT|nr:hypothetical protein [Spirosoma sordidisoli]RYC70686.1 hypothetical protein EQG79_00610 [Spirosoma sordidisoli]
MENEVVIHPDSLRACAYEVLNALYGSGPVDDSNITIYQIEPELIAQQTALRVKDDARTLQLGQQIAPWRITTRTVTLSGDECASCDTNVRSAPIPTFLSWNGTPYITNVSCCGASLVPVAQRWQLPVVSRRNNVSTYCVEGNSLFVYTTTQLVAVDELSVTGAMENPWEGLDRNDPAYWEGPWQWENNRAVIKERAEMRLRGGNVATWQRADKKNEGTETPINQP